MTLTEAMKKYNEVIGPIPTYLVECMSEEELKEKLITAIDTGKELEYDEDGELY